MRRTFPPIQTVLTGAMVAIVGFFSSFAILLQGLVSIGASETQAASGLMAAALSMGVAGIVLSLATRLPVSVAWSTPGAALLAVTAPAAGGFPEAVGAFVIAGCLTLFAGLCKPLGRFASSIPAPLAKAMLAGILLPLCLRPFQAAVDIPYFVLPLFLIWLVAGRINRFLGVPATVVAAAIMIFATADLSSMSQVPLIATPDMTVPQFSLAAALGIAVPLFLVTMVTQNVPGLAIIRAYGYDADSKTLLSGVGGASLLSAVFGAPAACLAAITAGMCANDDSHPDPKQRYWSAVMAGIFYCFFGLFAGIITTFASLAPPALVASVAGIALIGVMVNSALSAFEEEGYRDAAAITFLLSASGISVFGMGGAVWGLLAGLLVQMLQKRR